MLLKVLVGAVFALGLLSPAWAIEPFVVKDIRVEGLQRTEAGTVFSYLPIKVKDTVDDAKASAAIKALYATGFYSDVRIEAENDVLIVTIQERPAIASVATSQRHGCDGFGFITRNSSRPAQAAR